LASADDARIGSQNDVHASTQWIVPPFSTAALYRVLPVESASTLVPSTFATDTIPARELAVLASESSSLLPQAPTPSAAAPITSV
jgi:hypothetical protein